MSLPDSEPSASSRSSPDWQPGTRLVIGVLLILMVIILLYALRQLLVPVVLAMLLAYVLHPLVTRLELKARIPRWAAVGLIYVVLVLVMAGMGTGIGLAVSQALAGIGDYLSSLSTQIPSQIERLMDLRFSIGPWLVDLGNINLNPFIDSITAAISPLLSQTGSVLTTVAGATATAVGNTLIVLIVAFYLLLDSSKFGEHLLRLVPDSHKADAQMLMRDSGKIWAAFLRGQLILALAVGAVTGVIMAILGVRFALGLGLIAGLLEFVPIFGPWITGLLSVLVALFQGTNPWGLTALGFAALILIASIVIQQAENNILYPRIIGHSLKLNPLVVLLALLAAGSLAGVIGLLLAAPTVATLRLCLGYVYWKVVGVETQPTQIILAPMERRRPWITRAAQRLRALFAEDSGTEAND